MAIAIRRLAEKQSQPTHSNSSYKSFQSRLSVSTGSVFFLRDPAFICWISVFIVVFLPED
jgi:hypothetical protein